MRHRYFQNVMMPNSPMGWAMSLQQKSIGRLITETHFASVANNACRSFFGGHFQQSSA